MLYLYGESGTTYLYIHLNNDLTMKNDNRASASPGVAVRARAQGRRSASSAGQPIGFVGDSGDANGIARTSTSRCTRTRGAAVNPFPYLQKAKKLLFAAAQGKPFTAALHGTSSTYDGTLTLDVDQVTSWPGTVARQGRRPRSSSCTVPPETLDLRPDRRARRRRRSLTTLKAGEPGASRGRRRQNATLEAALGEPLAALRPSAIELGQPADVG